MTIFLETYGWLIIKSGLTLPKLMKWDVVFKGFVERFSGYGGWIYVVILNKYTKELKQRLFFIKFLKIY